MENGNCMKLHLKLYRDVQKFYLENGKENEK